MKKIGQVMLYVFGYAWFFGIPILTIWALIKYWSILIPLALGCLIVLFFSVLGGGLTYWLGSRKSLILVLLGASLAVWIILDGVRTLGHDWSTWDTSNRIVNVLSWAAYFLATVVGFLAGLSKRAENERLVAEPRATRDEKSELDLILDQARKDAEERKLKQESEAAIKRQGKSEMGELLDDLFPEEKL
jgi:hypothetical protein